MQEFCLLIKQLFSHNIKQTFTRCNLIHPQLDSLSLPPSSQKSLFISLIKRIFSILVVVIVIFFCCICFHFKLKLFVVIHAKHCTSLFLVIVVRNACVCEYILIALMFWMTLLRRLCLKSFVYSDNFLILLLSIAIQIKFWRSLSSYCHRSGKQFIKK